jgi:hypothetical protein
MSLGKMMICVGRIRIFTKYIKESFSLLKNEYKDYGFALSPKRRN